MNNKDLLLRSLLFVPGHVDKFFNSAIRSKADALVFDLEDSVPQDKKDYARESIEDKVASAKLEIPLFVRLNSRETGLLEKDLKMTALPQVAGFIFPKVKDSNDIIYLENMLLSIEKQKGMEIGKLLILPLIETTEAVLNVFEIAKASSRIIGLVFGHEDFLLDLKASHSNNSRNLLIPRMMIAMVARATGCHPIDTPYLQIDDLEGCANHIKESRELGCSGMLVLHPSQLDVVNQGFSPSREEIEKAEKIVLLNEEAKKNNRSIAFLEGKFIAPPILKQAECILEISEKIKRLQKK